MGSRPGRSSILAQHYSASCPVQKSDQYEQEFSGDAARNPEHPSYFSRRKHDLLCREFAVERGVEHSGDRLTAGAAQQHSEAIRRTPTGKARPPVTSSARHNGTLLTVSVVRIVAPDRGDLGCHTRPFSAISPRDSLQERSLRGSMASNISFMPLPYLPQPSLDRFQQTTDNEHQRLPSHGAARVPAALR